MSNNRSKRNNNNNSKVQTNNNRRKPNNNRRNQKEPIAVKVQNERKQIRGTKKNLKKNERKIQKEETDWDWWKSAAGVVGTMLGSGLGILAKGLGDYELESNSLVASATDGKLGNEVPIVYNTKAANIIRHREYITDIFGSTNAFSKVSYLLNPGLDSTFPWLAPIANSYQCYRFRGAIVEFKSLSSEYSTANYLGYVAIASQYNSVEPAYTDRMSMNNSEYSNSGKPSEDLLHPIECAPQQLVLSELYTRSTDVPSNADPRMYDLCRVTVATGGQTSNAVVGELWITYEVEMYHPKLATLEGNLVKCYHGCATTGIAVATQKIFGTDMAPFPVNTAQTITPTLVDSTITFPQSIHNGYYQVDVRWTHATPVAMTVPSISVTGGSLVNDWWATGTGSNVQSPNAGVVSSSVFNSMLFNVDAPSATITYGTTGTIGTQSCCVTITQIPTACVITTLQLSEARYQKRLGKPMMSQINYCEDDSSSSSDFDTRGYITGRSSAKRLTKQDAERKSKG